MDCESLLSARTQFLGNSLEINALLRMWVAHGLKIVHRVKHGYIEVLVYHF